MESFNIIKVEEAKPRQENIMKIKNYTYRINDYHLHISANIQIIFYDENDSVCYYHNKLLKDEEFRNWGADDTYIDNIVLAEVEKLKS